jgi:hypothetical protein
LMVPAKDTIDLIMTRDTLGVAGALTTP